MQDDVELLLASIRKMAEAEKAEILAATDREIAKINELAQAEMQRLQSQTFSELQDRLRTELDSIIDKTKLDMRNKIINEKNKAVDRIFEMAAREIDNLDYHTKTETFKRLIRDAIRRINSAQVRLRIAKTDMGLWQSIKQDFADSISVEPCEGPEGTVIAVSGDGAQWIDNSIETRLKVAQKVMRPQLAKLLFTSGMSGEKR